MSKIFPVSQRLPSKPAVTQRVGIMYQWHALITTQQLIRYKIQNYTFLRLCTYSITLYLTSDRIRNHLLSRNGAESQCSGTN